MKYSDIQAMSKEELKTKLQELQLKLGKLQFQRRSKSLKKGHELGILKKDIARIQTFLHI